MLIWLIGGLWKQIQYIIQMESLNTEWLYRDEKRWQLPKQIWE